MSEGEEMKRIICDRCKVEYSPDPDWKQTPEFEYRVRYYWYRAGTYKTMTLDLCRNCQADLNKWLSRKDSEIANGGNGDD